VRTWALSAGLSLMSAACSAVPIDPFEVPVGKLSGKPRADVVAILADVAAKVELEANEVQSRPEIYEYLLTEMPFTAGILRELNRGKWDIHRDAEKPDKAVFYVAEPGSMRLRFELVLKDETRRFYVCHGRYAMGLFPDLEGRTLVVLRTVPEGVVLRVDAMVYVRVDTPFYAAMAKGLRSMVENVVRDKSAIFIRAARWVAEEAARRPEWLYTQVKESAQVDPEILEDFHRRFLVR
jgi:hypothetical protein